nr:MAG TPA: hypothetical protein [Caudoviricetes sp.]
MKRFCVSLFLKMTMFRKCIIFFYSWALVVI